MYAIIRSGGQQLRVAPGETARLAGTAGEPGAELTLDEVLLVETDGGAILAGAPLVANARVLAVIDGETHGPKIRVFKKKRRKGMRRTKGHRAVYTRIRIKDILLEGFGIGDAGFAPDVPNPQSPITNPDADRINGS